jgi:hypothetical protein
VPTRYVHSALRLTHYWWPLVVGWSLLLVVHRALHRPWNPGGAAMLLLGIMAAYSWDRLLDPPATELTAGLRRTLALAAFAASAVGALLLATLPAPTAALVPLIGAAVLLYPAIKRFPATKTVFVPLVWTWCAIALGLAALTPRLLAIDLIGPLAADVALTLPGLLIIAHVV